MNPIRYFNTFILLVAITGISFIVFSGHKIKAQDTQPPKVSDIKITGVTATSALISWMTDEDADATVNYGLDEQHGINRDARFIKPLHEILLTNLLPSTVYHFRIVSTDKDANQTIASGFSFVTKGLIELPPNLKVNEKERAAAERILTSLKEITEEELLALIASSLKEKAAEIGKAPKIIGSPKVEAGATEATFIWTTDIPSNSMVHLVPESRYNPSAEDPYDIVQGDPSEAKTEHRITVIGLEPATTYHYRVVSENELGNRGRSEDLTFATKGYLPEIAGLNLLKIEETSATLAVYTSIPAAVTIEYLDQRTGVKKTKGDPLFSTSHTIQLSDLVLGTPYTAVAIAENQVGDKVKSRPINFVTVRDTEPPVISKVINESTLFPEEEVRIQTIVSWETDEPSVCRMFYHPGLVAGEELISTDFEVNPVLKHVQILTSLPPSSVYKFWVECKDRSGNSVKSNDFVLITPEKEKSIIDIIIENFEGTFGWIKNITGKK
jgi:hypothetical protein